ncbi:MAG: hypothetical protein MJZ89_02135 [Paludibacteraceae bacterium]|nr:hypothetical protein [Paludibacteraceae bacterium]
MAKQIYILLVGLALILCACQTESPTIDKAVDLRISTHQTNDVSTYLIVDPEDHRAYYYANIIPAQDYFQLDYNDEHFMMLTTDSLYAYYLVWRHSYLREDVQYIADFKSHCLSQGYTNSYIGKLQPDTEYLFYAFCFNPQTLQPLGKLQKHFFQTLPYDSLRSSTMVIDFHISMYKQNGLNKCEITTRPQDKGLPTKDPYLTNYFSDEWLQREYDGNLLACAEDQYQSLIRNPQNFSEYASEDIYTEQAHERVVFEEGKNYWVFSAPYCNLWQNVICYRYFTYHVNSTLPFSHDVWQNDTDR